MSQPLITDKIQQMVSNALKQAQQDGLLNLETEPDIVIERPNNSENGDFATNLPLQLARATRINPVKLAEILAERIHLSDELAKIEPAPPGFINFYLGDSWIQKQVDTIRHAGSTFGDVNVGNSQSIMIEFVSVNPTGPVHVGHARGAVLGSTLANILSAAGYSVTKEYYINDAGNQMDAFYNSVHTRYLQLLGETREMPENSYEGEYIKEIAAEIIQSDGEAFASSSPTEDSILKIREIGLVAKDMMLQEISKDLIDIGVNFDNWFSESSLFQTQEYEEAINLLRSQNYLSEREGALWFNSNIEGREDEPEDRDSVVIRSSGEPTYFASDIAYHHNKFLKRNFGQVINIWGADHQGHVARMKSAVQALGINSDSLTILISQLVTLKRGNELVRASKRTGDFVTLRELVEDVGLDACRFFFLTRAASTHMDFDLELAKKESSDNPVYYVQYAHARISNILKLANERGLNWTTGNLELLDNPNEIHLIRTMLRLPELVDQSARVFEPHHLPHYAVELSTAFHSFYENCRVVSANEEDNEISLARLKLVQATQVVLQRCLQLMGMNAPESM